MAYILTKEALEVALRDEFERSTLIGLNQLGYDQTTAQFTRINTFYSGVLSSAAFPAVITPIDLREHWVEGGLTKPVGYTAIAAQSRRGFNYANVSSSVQLTDIRYQPPEGHQVNHFCTLMRGTGIHPGIASWSQRQNAPGHPGGIFVSAKSLRGGVELNLTPIMPADIYEKKYQFSVKVNRNNVEFYLGGSGYEPRLRAVIVTAPVAEEYPPAHPHPTITEPYAIAVARCGDFPTMMNAIVQLSYTGAGIDVESTLPLSPQWLRASDGDPCPPRVYRLYEEETDTLLAGSSVDPDVTSHPFPLFGYEGKTINFMSDEAGSLDIEVLKQTGNWRVHSTVAIAANTLVPTTIVDEEVIGRIVFTPTLPPADILEAEVLLR